jgi:hypothetical protein
MLTMLTVHRTSRQKPAFRLFMRGIRIVPHEDRYCSLDETIVPELIDAVKF